MATINPVTPGIAGATVTRVASTPAGDVVPFTGGDLLLHFENGHASAITVNIVPTITSVVSPDAGPLTVPTRSIEIAAGAEAVIFVPVSQARAYLNSSRQIPLTYTSGDAALTVMALAV